MGALFIIISVIAAISLYEYYTSRSWQQVTSSNRNDVVFEHRNKEYGAYQIRKNYNKQLMTILFCFVLGLGGVFGAYRLSYDPSKHHEELIEEFTTIPLDLSDNIDEIVEIEPESQVEQQVAKSTYAFQDFEIVDEEVPLTIDVPEEGKEAGLTAHEGTDGFELGVDVEPKIQNIVETPKEIVSDEIEVFVEELALYPGGSDARSKFINDHLNYTEEMLDYSGNTNCWIKFVIDKKGKLKNTIILKGLEDCPECQQEIIKVMDAMPIWEPGKINGKPVNSYYKMNIKLDIR